jgi:hypothetical protein
MTAVHFAAWLYANLIPFSVIGIALVIAGHYYDGQYTPAARRVFCGLVVALVLSAYLSAAEIYDLCNDPQYVTRSCGGFSDVGRTCAGGYGSGAG